MSSSLIRGRYVITRILGPHDAHVINDGAVFQKDGVIVEVGGYQHLAAKYRPDEVVGSPDHLIIPGFVNSHHHVGLTPLQLGSPYLPLELWLIDRIGARDVDPYLDTLYSAFEMIESGITTVQHLHGRRGMTATEPWSRKLHVSERVMQAYQDVGMRVSYSLPLRNQNLVVYESEENFIKHLPDDLADEVKQWAKSLTVSPESYLDLFRELWERWGRDPSLRTRIQLAPTNLQWCSDHALVAVSEVARKYTVGIHMHLVETVYQKAYARRRTGGTAVRHLHNLGLLGPHLTLGHSVWLSDDDIELIATTGTMICHCASSNLRLRSGIAPINRLTARGVRIAIGLDEAGINDDRDMFQEIRVVLNLHRTPGMDETVLTPPQVFQMATENGAATTGFAGLIGTIEPGKAADLVLVKWERIAYPYLDQNIQVMDGLVHRGRPSAVDAVLVGGEVVFRDGQFTRVNKEEMLQQFAASLRVPLLPHEERRRRFARSLLPYVKRFYESWIGQEAEDLAPGSLPSVE
jgi:cytosine/adenosine deaminase-related metal-dependent hydrolase